MIIMGIDPGTYGGIALYCRENNKLTAMATPLCVNKYQENILNTPEACKFIENSLYWFKAGKFVDKVCFEKVGAMPKQGVTSMFNFGRIVGSMATLASFYCANMQDIEYLPSTVWKKYFKLSKDKDESIRLATKIFGQGAKDLFWPRKKDDGVAEAALLALYGAENFDVT